MKTWKMIAIGALVLTLSACVTHPRSAYYGSPGNSAYGHAQGNGPKGFYGPGGKVGMRGHGSKVEAYGVIDAGVGYQRTKIKH
ncbi:MAG: hypothetical protein SOX43_01675 [Pelistega sp.]|nr:hypothetical protein [Pelistega sp.]